MSTLIKFTWHHIGVQLINSRVRAVFQKDLKSTEE